ncbi:MAG: hypothetical protein ABNH00_08520 [Dokdonia sp.]|jgi:hypothetical protein
MKKDDHLKEGEDIKHGVQKDVHINQYGDQTEHHETKKRSSRIVPPAAPTLSGNDNAVQKNAEKDARLRAKAQKKANE